MRKRTLLLLPFAWALHAEAQKISPQLVNTTGNTLRLGTVTIEYSVGEMAISSLSSPSNYLTQGLLQPRKKSIVTALANETSSESSIFLYPNPVVENVFIRCQENYSAIIYTGEGIKIRQIETNAMSDATDLAKGLYIVKILDAKNTTISTLKFIKL
jgi:hypothetical protein